MTNPAPQEFYIIKGDRSTPDYICDGETGDPKEIHVREVLPGRTDTDRLEWTINNDVKLIKSRDGAWSTWPDTGEWAKTPRAAIDAAMDVQEWDEKSLDLHLRKRDESNPVDQSLEEAAERHPKEEGDNGNAEISFKAGHQRGEAIGEARGWRDAIEYLGKHDSMTTHFLKEEAKRRGVKL